MSDPHSNPDWFRVKYSVAATCVNWALSEEASPQDERLQEAEKELRELLRVIGEGCGRSWWAKRRADPWLEDFLRQQVAPSALVLFAGIALAKGVTEPGPELEGSIESVVKEIGAGGMFNPFFIVNLIEESVEESDELLAADVSYNLACFYGQSEQHLERSWAHLRDSFETTPLPMLSLRRTQAARDPVLQTTLREFQSEWLAEKPARVSDLIHRRRSWV